jgi:hypothetical protein
LAAAETAVEEEPEPLGEELELYGLEEDGEDDEDLPLAASLVGELPPLVDEEPDSGGLHGLNGFDASGALGLLPPPNALKDDDDDEGFWPAGAESRPPEAAELCARDEAGSEEPDP